MVGENWGESREGKLWSRCNVVLSKNKLKKILCFKLDSVLLIWGLQDWLLHPIPLGTSASLSLLWLECEMPPPPHIFKHMFPSW